MTVKPAFQTADQGIGLTALDGESADDGGVGTNDRACRFRVDAGTADQREIVIDIVAVAWIVFRVDHGEIGVRANAQAEALKARFDDLRTPDQDRDTSPFFQKHLSGAQHALVFAFGKDDTLLFRALGTVEDRLHDEAGTPDEAVQLIEIGIEIGDGSRCDATCGGSARDGGCNAQDEARIERRGDQVVRAEDRRLFAIGLGSDFGDFLAGQFGNRTDRRHLHLFIDAGCAAIERTAEDVREAENVVDLVREV